MPFIRHVGYAIMKKAIVQKEFHKPLQKNTPTRASVKIKKYSGLDIEETRQQTHRNPMSFLGGAKRDRTADLYNAIVALSQLSYGPTTKTGRI